MRLRSVESSELVALREEHRREAALGIAPVFYSRLTDDSQAYLIAEDRPGGDGTVTLGYALAIERRHDGHSHVTAIELHLTPGNRHRYEDVLDLLRDELHPTAYLTRTDDCRYNATLLSRGHQVEPTALVMVWPTHTERRAAQEEIGTDMGGEGTAVELAPLSEEHLDTLKPLLDVRKDREILDELQTIVSSGRGWAVIEGGRAVAVMARRDGGDGVHELLDFAFARASERSLARALESAAEALELEGLRPAAVIDANEAARYRIFRQAGFFTTASYLVFYDAAAGRPSVARITTAELRGLMQRGDHFRLVDVLGEKHWKEGHLPGSEWIDFKGLGREAKRRFEFDEPLVLYCSGFT